MDLVIEVVNLVAEGFKSSRKFPQFLAGESKELSVRKDAGYYETEVPNALGKLKICYRRNDEP